MILVTGASGFIATHLIQALHEKKRAIVSSGRSKPTRLRGDFISAEHLVDVAGHIDCVVHLAGRAHVPRDASLESREKFRSANVQYLIDIAGAFGLKGTRRFIFISSIGVLGDETQPNLPFTHKSAPDPRNEYTQSKLEAEIELRKVAEETGMEYVVIRPPMVYGADAKGNFATMVRWLSRGLPLPFGLVENRRSLVGVENLVDLIITSIDHPAAANRTFLVADGKDISTKDLLKRTATAMGKTAFLLPVPPIILKAGLRYSGNEELAKRLLGSLEIDIEFTCRTLQWRPPLSFDIGLLNAVSGRIETPE
ncbi:NAD-dependent epimerase/dehydratase family protein [Rhizobium wuzhouense]|uniref:NAD-dependent epimerase/dehydratase family protein n=1 Tax=Rhizobium wuzhouense TaxID=1986026 RepID=UPI001403CEE8|nr:NAD-dependent epimerase/dehydratase family protein [Rhizobium wuzhouense]